MAYVEKKGKRWRIRWRQLEGGQEVQKTFTVTTSRADANRLCREITDAVKLNGRWIPPRPEVDRSDLTLAHTMAAWLKSRQRRLSERTIRRYAGMLEEFRRWMEKNQLRSFDLSRSLLEDYEAYLLGPTGRHGRPRKQSTATKHLEAIELWWVWAWDRADENHWEHLEIPRPKRLEKPRRTRPRVVAPTWAEMDACLHAIETPWHYRVGMLSRFFGLRRSECLLLTWEDFQNELTLLEIRAEITKGGYGGRRVPVPTALRQELAGWGLRQGFLVNAPHKEREAARGPGHRGTLDKHFRRAWKRAGVRELVWKGHPLRAFRKGLRTGLIREGFSSDLVNVYIGHNLAGTGELHYTDQELARWDQLRRLVEAIPAICTTTVQPLVKRS